MNLKALLLTLAVVAAFTTLLFIQSDTSVGELIEKVKPDFNNDIEIVKNTVFLNQTENVERSLKTIAGVRGTIKWTAFTPAKEQENIGGVRVNITREREYKNDSKDVQIEYLVNRDTKQVGVSKIILDGEEKEITSGLYLLGLMLL